MVFGRFRISKPPETHNFAVLWTSCEAARLKRPGFHKMSGEEEAETLINLGELSSARTVLEGGELAPGTVATLHTL